jgi:hypothetical protein
MNRAIRHGVEQAQENVAIEALALTRPARKMGLADGSTPRYVNRKSHGSGNGIAREAVTQGAVNGARLADQGSR